MKPWAILGAFLGGGLLVLYLLLHFFGGGISLLYTSSETVGQFMFATNYISGEVFVATAEEFSYPRESEITVPDTYKGYPVTRLGGYFGRGLPMPFLIDPYFEKIIFDGMYTYSEASLPEIEEPYHIEKVVFDLNIGKNLQTIHNVMIFYYSNTNADGSITLYLPVVRVHCSEENEHFYSSDGKLYYKGTNELVTNFAYAEDE